MGRCVAVNQMPDIRAKADAMIWCITPDDIDLGASVKIAGWNKVAEIVQLLPIWTGPEGRRQVHNHQVPVEQVHPLEELVQLITSTEV